ncbi:RagB/SusD family nutrient uptake outer membrane protein [Sphingobacterium sp. PU5-4]|uniref:RagB/SusD family nutrient uptake outer membrane protein n=1 Tax=Sphingobacterium tenebrionis TaxID=3111775 RepID=A0ABU8I2Y0_9SPHI
MKVLNKINVILLAGLALTASSCNKYLDVEPDNRTTINSVDKVAQLVATAYPGYDYLSFAEAASDNAEDKGPGVGSSVDTRDRPYVWEDQIGSGTNTPTNYWNGCYEAIAAANQALESIEENQFGDEVLQYKGEALIARAYAHHMLAIFFAKSYEIGGTNDSPGIPYVKAPGTKVFGDFTRGTVKSTYENIVSDLEEGLKYVSDQNYQVPKYHFTKAAAHAFASRLYLFLGEWQKAADHASLSTPSGEFSGNLRPINTTFKNMTSGEFNAAFTRSDVKSTLLLTNAYSTWTYVSSPRYGYGAKLARMFTDPHVTGGVLDNKVLSYGAPNYTTYKWLYYFFYTGPGIGYPYIMQPLLTLDEAIMNRAEANAELGKYDLAVADLNTFYSTKIRNYTPSLHTLTLEKIQTFYVETDPKKALVKAVLNAKKAEFLEEGLRWIDVTRRKLPVIHNVISPTKEETEIELGPDDPRRVFQIPEEAKIAGIELNPR